MKKSLLVVAALSFLFTQSVLAEGVASAVEDVAQDVTQDSSDHSGAYIGLDLAYINHALPGGTAVSNVADGGSFVTAQVRGGYQFNRYFAVEANYLPMVDDSNTSTLGQDHLKNYAVDVLGKVSYPFNESFSIYGEAGLAYAHEDNLNIFLGTTLVNYNTGDIMPAAGLGISVYPMHWLSIDAGYKHYFSMDTIGSFNIFPVGLTVHF